MKKKEKEVGQLKGIIGFRLKEGKEKAGLCELVLFVNGIYLWGRGGGLVGR